MTDCFRTKNNMWICFELYALRLVNWFYWTWL